MPTKLTKTMRDFLTQCVIDHKYLPLFKAVSDEYEALGDRVYDRCIPAAAREHLAAFRKMTDTRWFVETKGINAAISPSDSYVGYELPTSKTVTTVSRKPVGVLAGEERIEYQKIEQKRAKLHDERHAAIRQVDGFLMQFSTIEKLRDAWPEGSHFIDQLTVPSKGTALVVPAETINKIFGLPPEITETSKEVTP